MPRRSHSRSAQEALVDQYNLRTTYGYPLLHLKARREDACKELERNTEVAEERKSGIITISVTDHDRNRAAALAQGYVDQLNKLVANLSTSAAGRERRFLEQRLKEVKQDLDEAARELSEFSSRNSTLDPKDQGKAMVEAAAVLQGQLIAAQSELRGLEAIYTANNVRVRGLRARIGELRKQLANVSGSNGTDPAAPFDATNSDMPFPSIRQLPLLGVKYADLYRRARIQETVYQVLTQQYEMAKVQEAKEIPTVRVLDAAEVPEKKWAPHRALLTILGVIVGWLLGCVWVIANDQWHKREQHDPYKTLAYEVVGSLQKSRVWRGGEAGLTKVVHVSRSSLRRFSNRNGGNSNGGGNSGSTGY